LALATPDCALPYFTKNGGIQGFFYSLNVKLTWRKHSKELEKCVKVELNHESIKALKCLRSGLAYG